MMKKFLKSKILWTVVILLIITVGAYFIFFNQPKKTEYVMSDVISGNVIQTVSATGQVKSASEISLNFKNPGKLAVLNVKTGDNVTANQVLAQLKANDLSNNINKARAALAQAQADLAKLKAGAMAQDIAVTQAAVAKAQNDLANAQNDLANAETTYSQALQNERQSALADINSALAKANISLQKVKDTIYFQGNENNFTTNNYTLQQQVKHDYQAVMDEISDVLAKYDLAKANVGDDIKIDDALNGTLNVSTRVSNLLSNLSNLLNYVTINSTLTQSDLDTMKTSIGTERTTINSSLITVQTAGHDLTDARLNYRTKVDAAKNEVSVAERNLASAQASLTFKQAPARLEDIALYQARVASASADWQTAQDQYADTIISAPIAGIITDTGYEVGEQTNLTTPVIKMLAAKNYEIEVDIPESDIVKIDVADAVGITLDAFSSDDIFSGIVTVINPAQTEISDVVYYKVTVTFSDIQPANVQSLMAKIKPGMTANVTVNTARADNVLLIPLRAVKDENGKKTVQILENGSPKSVEVSLGLSGDEGQIEVKTGLNAGQKVITFIRNP